MSKILEICTECQKEKDWDELLKALEENTGVKWGWVDGEPPTAESHKHGVNMVFFGWDDVPCLLRGNSFDLGEAHMVDREEFVRRVREVVGPNPYR